MPQPTHDLRHHEALPRAILPRKTWGNAWEGRALFAVVRQVLVTLGFLLGGILCPSWVALAADPLESGDYRHLHRELARAASEGNYESLLERCQQLLEISPQDAEALFFQSLAYAGLGDQSASREARQRALQAGLPMERFLVGPRSWMRAAEYAVDEEELGAPHALPLLHGPMIGAVADCSAKIWLRTDGAVDVQVVATPEGRGGPSVCSPTIATSEATDNTAVLHLEGLTPETRYAYDVRINGRGVLTEAKRSFTTAPTPGRSTRLTFGFGGGAAYIPRNQRMWQVIASHEPQQFLLLGDNVYIDHPRDRDYQRYLYYRRQSQPDFRRLCGATAVYSIWDDHDFGTDNCAGGPLIDDPPWKPRVWELFRENWGNPGYGQGAAFPGCWYDFCYGDIHFLLLDGRYYRTTAAMRPYATPTMLGSVQRQWLLERLERSPARIKVLVSPVPWVGGNEDKWNGFPAEREQIFSEIERQRIDGVLLLSADRHRSDLLVTHRPNGYDLYEFMSSRLTNHHRHAEIDEREGALFSYNKKCSFGLVTIDTRPDDAYILYRIITIDGETVFHFRLNASQLELPR